MPMLQSSCSEFYMGLNDKIENPFLNIYIYNQVRVDQYLVHIHPSPKVMADFFRHKNQHDVLIQFAQFLVDLWSVC